MQFETQYNIPAEVQRWIIKQQLASDKSKWCLKDFQVTKDGGTEQEVYLFVVQGMKERIKEEYLRKRQQQVEDNQFQQQQMTQKENYRKQTQIASANNTPNQSYNNSIPPQQHYGQPFDAPNQGGYMNRAPPVPKSIAIGQPEKPGGWNCPVCTFHNEPYRLSCKMCTSAPPESYEPPTDHGPSAEEMKFMQ